MAREDSEPTADADRFIDTGIYRRLVGPMSAAETDERFASHHQTAAQVLDDVKQWLMRVIQPYINGPLADEVNTLPLDDRWLSTVLGGSYRWKDDIPGELRDTLDDAFQALQLVANIQRNLPDEGTCGAFGPRGMLVKMAIDLGRFVDRVYVRQFEPLVRSERRRREGTSAKRKAQAALTDKQRDVAFAFVRKREKAGDSAKAACQQAAAHLKVGTLPDLAGQRIDISPKRLRNLYSNRNKASRQ